MVPRVSATSSAVRRARSLRSRWRCSPAVANSRGALAAYRAPPRAARRAAERPRENRSRVLSFTYIDVTRPTAGGHCGLRHAPLRLGDPADREGRQLVPQRVDRRLDEVVADDLGGLILRRADHRTGHG